MKIASTLLSIVVVVIAVSSSAPAQERKTARLTGGVQTDTNDGDMVFSRTLILRPRIAEQSLSSRLFPSADKLRRGSAAAIYLRMAHEASTALQLLTILRQSDLFETPLEEIDVDFVRANAALRWSELKRAAFRERADWQYPFDEEPWADIVLPDAQQSRMYSNAIVQSTRADIKSGLIPEAEEKICIALAYAKHIGETPMAVCRIIQYVHSSITLQALEELVQHPMAPNYFWDMTSIPKQFIDVRQAIQCEAALVEKTFPELLSLEQFTEEREWNEFHDRVIAKLPMFQGNAQILVAALPENPKAIADWIKIARDRLPEKFPKYANKMNSMCDSEVSVRYWWERVQQLNRERFAVALLEPHQAIPRTFAEDKRLQTSCADELFVSTTVLSSCGPFVRVAWELEQRFALLRVVESIRDWSGRNEGKLPPSLDVLVLPVPNDCMTNKPFFYQLSADGKSADLRSGKVLNAAKGVNEQEHIRHYHLTLE